MSYKDYDFSLWCDFIERDFIENDFVELIDNKIINGATSNPAIFQAAINSSKAYIEDKKVIQGSKKDRYEALALKDIKRAATKLLPLYKSNNDGFVSIEVDPTLCNDAFGTIEEGVRLYESIGMPNVMIKVPATDAGFVAMRELSAHGININATLIFSPSQAQSCFDAISEGMSKSKVDTKAVISVFVSRFDRVLDSILKDRAKFGIINAMSCYHKIESGGNKNIKTLFASTGVKGNDLEPSYYIKELLLPHSVNTAPLATINSFINTKNFTQSKLILEVEIENYFNNIRDSGVDIDALYQRLLNEGLQAFVESFDDMLSNL